MESYQKWLERSKIGKKKWYIAKMSSESQANIISLKIAVIDSILLLILFTTIGVAQEETIDVIQGDKVELKCRLMKQ